MLVCGVMPLYKRRSFFTTLAPAGASVLLFAAPGVSNRARAEMPFRIEPNNPATEAQMSVTPRGLLQIVSPDTAQTFAGGVTTRFLLEWDRRAQVLRAFITFTNSPYQNDSTSRREEQFLFRLPGVALDPATGVFSARDPQGHNVPIAVRVRRGGLFSTSNAVEPTAGTTIYVSKISGRVKVSLTANPSAAAVADKAQHWVIDGQVGIL